MRTNSVKAAETLVDSKSSAAATIEAAAVGSFQRTAAAEDIVKDKFTPSRSRWPPNSAQSGDHSRQGRGAPR